MARPFWLTKLLIRTGIARLLPVAHRLTDGGAKFLRYYSDAVLATPVEELLDPALNELLARVPRKTGPLSPTRAQS